MPARRNRVQQAPREVTHPNAQGYEQPERLARRVVGKVDLLVGKLALGHENLMKHNGDPPQIIGGLCEERGHIIARKAPRHLPHQHRYARKVLKPRTSRNRPGEHGTYAGAGKGTPAQVKNAAGHKRKDLDDHVAASLRPRDKVVRQRANALPLAQETAQDAHGRRNTGKAAQLIRGKHPLSMLQVIAALDGRIAEEEPCQFKINSQKSPRDRRSVSGARVGHK